MDAEEEDKMGRKNRKARKKSHVKKEEMTSPKKSKSTIKIKKDHLIYGVLGVLVLVFFGLNMGSAVETAEVSSVNLAPKAPSQEPAGQPAKNADPTVRIPVSEISSTMKKYTFDTGGTTVKFMVVLGSDGKPRTAFDACEVCGGAKGYRQSGTDVICNNCGRHFKIDSLGTANMGGGCWPSHIPHVIEDGEIVIAESDLAKGARYF